MFVSISFYRLASCLFIRARVSKMTDEVTSKIEFVPKCLDSGFYTLVCA